MLKNWKYNTFSKYLEVHKKNYIECYVATFIHHCIIVSWEKQWSRDLKLKVFWDIWSRFWNKGFRPSLSCWRTIPHYNLVIIIKSVVNVGNLTTTYLVVWNLKLFWIFWDNTTICQIRPALFCDILPPKTSETEILCNLSTKGVVQTLPWLNWLMSFAYSITRYF